MKLNSTCFTLICFIASSSELLASNGLQLKNSIRPSLQYKPNDNYALNNIQLESGMGLLFTHETMDFSVDYKFAGSLENRRRDENNVDELLGLTQIVSTKMRSSALNELLGVKANLNASGSFRKSDSTYKYKVTPGFSRSIFNLAQLEVRYNYVQAKDSETALGKKTRGYSLNLKGELGVGGVKWNSQFATSSISGVSDSNNKKAKVYSLGLSGGFKDGSITWKSQYRNSNTSGEHSIGQRRVEQRQRADFLSFEARYRLTPVMHLKLSRNVNNSQDVHEQEFLKKWYGAALIYQSAAKPYSFSLKVDKVDESLFRQDFSLNRQNKENLKWNFQWALNFQ